MKKLNKMVAFLRRQPRWRLIAGAAALAVICWWLFGSSGSATGPMPTFAARRGPLEISVLEGGSLQALESQEIKCEVHVGYQGTKILKIVDEGYLVTDDDVKTNKVLCQLDSSDLEKQIVQGEIQYQTAAASLTDAEQNYEIQLSQNDADIKDAEQKAQFARMDFDKFMGGTITDKILEKAGLNALLRAITTNNVEATADATGFPSAAAPQPDPPVKDPPVTNAVTTPKPVIAADPPPPGKPAAADPPGPPAPDTAGPDVRQFARTVPIDFSEYASLDVLGDGDAKQKLRGFDDDLQVAQKELGQATTALEGTKRLFDKGFVPKTEITRDEIAYESARLKVETSITARALFLKYDFPRTAEEDLSKYDEALRAQDSARRVAISKLAQASAKLNSAKGQYDVAVRQKKDLADQLDKCSLCAKKSGLVVYGGSRDNYYFGNQEPIREGATVRELQSIITIPDMTRMSVDVKIHESYIKKIKKGQKARITVDAFPDQPLTGEITKVGVLPDSQDRWMNPDLKVYKTTITVDGTNDWVKPGMSAKVEILVSELSDVVYVPVQAIMPDDGKEYCYVLGAFKPHRREVQIGEFNDEFIQIKSGLKEGDKVLLSAPADTESSGASKSPAAPDAQPKAEPKASDASATTKT